MKLRAKKSHFQNLPEGKAPRRILPILLKLAYYFILLGILGGLGYVVAMRYLYVNGRGQVEIEKIKISSNHGGRIKAIHRQTGDTFCAGDILAVIDTGIECPGKEPDIRLIRLAYDIKLKQSEFDITFQRLKALEKGRDDHILPRALEIDDSFFQRQHLEARREMKRFQEKADLLAAEIAIKRKELAALRKELAVENDVVCGPEIISAAFDGSVYRVAHQPSEYVAEGAPLLVVVREDSDVFVEAFFDRRHMRYLVKGRKMTIEFPDRTSRMGRIIDYASSASYVADRTLVDYLPVEAQLRVNLKPVEAGDKNHWKRYDRMDVTVIGAKQ